jgi:predicted nucleotidyltransferase
MRLMLEDLPPTLSNHVDAIRRCIEAFNRVMPVEAVYFFGSHARGEARADSDVDLCVVSAGAERQFAAAAKLRHALWDVWPRPSFTLVPVSPERLSQKKADHDHFFRTILDEGIQVASAN